MGYLLSARIQYSIWDKLGDKEKLSNLVPRVSHLTAGASEEPQAVR